MDTQERLEICVDMGPWQRCPLPTDLHLILGTRLLGNTPESEGEQDEEACHVISFIPNKSKEKAERREHRDVITDGSHKTELGPGW